jgi:general stress protein 26
MNSDKKETSSPLEIRAKSFKLIKDINFGMLVTMDENGDHRSRPLSTAEANEAEECLYYFVQKSSSKVSEIQANASVNVAYASPSKESFVSVTGKASMVDDKALFERMWSPFYKAWFPDGIDDPELILVKVKVESLEYWDSNSNPLVSFFYVAKAIVTGTQSNEGENHSVDLNSGHSH